MSTDRIADVWQVVVDLADADPIAHDCATASGMRCTLCGAEPAIGAVTLSLARHFLACPYRSAVELRNAAPGYSPSGA